MLPNEYVIVRIYKFLISSCFQHHNRADFSSSGPKYVKNCDIFYVFYFTFKLVHITFLIKNL